MHGKSLPSAECGRGTVVARLAIRRAAKADPHSPALYEQQLLRRENSIHANKKLFVRGAMLSLHADMFAMMRRHGPLPTLRK